MGKGGADEALAGVLQLSFRCVCLIITMVLLLTVVGYAFVGIQSIWSENLSEEVDQLERTNELLELNNERFQANNKRLEQQVGKLKVNVKDLREQIGNFSEMNADLENEIVNLNDTRQDLDSTTSSMENQGEQLQTVVTDLKNETSTLQDTVQQLNATSMDLQNQLQQFRELEASIGRFVTTSSDSFNEILENTRQLYNDYISSTLTQLEALFYGMLNNIEYSNGQKDFNSSEYTEWLTRVSYLLPETADELLQKYPYSSNTITADDLQAIVNDIIEKQKQELESRVSSGTSLGWFSELQSHDMFEDLIQAANRRMLSVF